MTALLSSGPDARAQTRAARDGVRPARPATAVRAGFFPWVPVCLSVGIAVWFMLPALPGWWGLTIIAVCGVLALTIALTVLRAAERGVLGWRTASALRLAASALSLAVVGFGLMAIRSADVAAPIMAWRYYGPVEGRVVVIDRSSRDAIRLTLDHVVLRDTPADRMPERVRLSLKGDAAIRLPELGQRVMLTGHLGPPPGPAAPGSFDFRQSAWFARLGAVGYSRTPVMAVSSPEGGVWTLHRARLALSRAMQDRIGGQEGAVASALMTGDRSGISEATNDVMRASNLYHIISISGLHMGMLAGFIYGGIRIALVGFQAVGLSWPAHKIAAGVALVAAAIYLWLSGGGVATERAFVMVAVMLVAILVDRRAISLRTVSLAATIILIYSPESVVTPGFQMSFAATVALILIYGPWARVSPRLPFWLRPVAMLVLSSLVAAVATSPIAAAHFNRMAQYGLLANLLSVPVMGTLVMPAGVIAALLAPLGLAGPALWVMGIGTTWMLRVARYVADLDGAVTAVALPPAPVVPLMIYGAILAVLCWPHRGHIARLSPGGAGLALGLAMLATAGALWVTSARPLLLIAPEGDAVGLMTAQGRATSKPSGGGFAVDTWLLEDGDTAAQDMAAARPAWSGDKRDHHAPLRDGWQVWHLTGKGSGARAATECLAKRIVIATEPVEGLAVRPACILLDIRTLRKTGSVAVTMTPEGPVMTTARDVHRVPG